MAVKKAKKQIVSNNGHKPKAEKIAGGKKATPKQQELSAAELGLLAWQEIYAKRDKMMIDLREN